MDHVIGNKRGLISGCPDTFLVTYITFSALAHLTCRTQINPGSFDMQNKFEKDVNLQRHAHIQKEHRNGQFALVVGKESST